MRKQEHDAICRGLADQGKLIAAGFEMFRLAVIPPDAPGMQVEEMRKAFFAGAQHTWASIMGILEPGQEATPKDVDRMMLINDELDAFVAGFEAPAGGPVN
jgi:hypothetical protein